jgi:hypothetical protein
MSSGSATSRSSDRRLVVARRFGGGSIVAELGLELRVRGTFRRRLRSAGATLHNPSLRPVPSGPLGNPATERTRVRVSREYYGAAYATYSHTLQSAELSCSALPGSQVTHQRLLLLVAAVVFVGGAAGCVANNQAPELPSAERGTSSSSSRQQQADADPVVMAPPTEKSEYACSLLTQAEIEAVAMESAKAHEPDTDLRRGELWLGRCSVHSVTECHDRPPDMPYCDTGFLVTWTVKGHDQLSAQQVHESFAEEVARSNNPPLKVDGADEAAKTTAVGNDNVWARKGTMELILTYYGPGSLGSGTFVINRTLPKYLQDAERLAGMIVKRLP